MTNPATAKRASLGFWRRLGRDLVKNRIVYLMWIPVLAYYLVFHYAPMGGIVIAFQNYKPGDNFFKPREWVGLDHFVRFFESPVAGLSAFTALITIVSIFVDTGKKKK